MRIHLHTVMMTVFLSLIGGQFSSSGFASEEVHFDSAGVPPTPFQIKRAKAKGIKLKPKPGVPIIGFLDKPLGTEPFPAVILLHDCFGLRSNQKNWAKKLSQWGYVTLQVDGFSPRNLSETCSDLGSAFYLGIGNNNVVDVYGALSYLRGLPFVDKNRIAVMGWGFSAILSAVVRDGQQRYFDDKFKAAIAINPDCDNMTSGDFYIPLLLLIGEANDWNLASVCQRTITASKKLSNPISSYVYAGAYHGFDDKEFGEKYFYEKAQNTHRTPPRGATLEYNSAAHKDAQRRVKAFLAKHLN